MAKVVQMEDLQTGEIVYMYSVDARECMALPAERRRYRPVTPKGAAIVASQPEKIDPRDFKSEDDLRASDVTREPRGGATRGGAVAPTAAEPLPPSTVAELAPGAPEANAPVGFPVAPTPPPSGRAGLVDGLQRQARDAGFAATPAAAPAALVPAAPAPTETPTD